MNDIIKSELTARGADMVRFVDISGFPKEMTLGFDKAIVFYMALSRRYIIDSRNGKPFDWDTDEYLSKEKQVEDLADWAADFIQNEGYQAHSQSEQSNVKNGYVEQAYSDPELKQGISILPQKAIARAGGLGFIGKNNLLVTESFGCAITICSVLTDAPVIPGNHQVVESKCGSCCLCIDNCADNALLGNEWVSGNDRENIVDVSRCTCALKCMMACPFTIKYAESAE